jgi:uncharacterized damage-inducible protein DinB
MTMAKQLSAELQQQAANTKKLLERIPGDKLTWKPHEKSTQIGRLGMHVAELPISIARALETTGIDFAAISFKPTFPNTTAEILDTFDKSLATGVEGLEKASDEALSVLWKAQRGEQVIYEMPRSAVIRRALDHIIHHRGQLTVYLRLLDIPVPPTFGPTADER